jgi:hypothetical protein
MILQAALAIAIIMLGLTAQASCLPPECTAFPKDAGALNVRDFGAKGDGLADDTAAINAALAASGPDTGNSPWHDRIVYLPDGTYLISAALSKHYANGPFGSGAILVGQSRDRTIIRLKDAAEGYQDLLHPHAMIFTASKLLDGDATSGGKDYTGKGEGNDAYENFIENMTVDAGSHNPGAIGIDYLGNNIGAIRNVTIRTAAGSGATGIALTRKWPGPLLLSDVTVVGFETGIDIANTEYGVTLESVSIDHPRQTGLRNAHNIVASHALRIVDAPHAIVNTGQDGMIVLLNGEISGPADASAIENSGYMNIRDTHISGYRQLFGNAVTGDMVDGVYDGAQRLGPSRQDWSLPIESPPPVAATPVETWVSVAKFGALPDSGRDETAAIRQAFASGADTIYFPHGSYLISDNIAVPSTVQRIVGMMSTIGAFSGRQATFRRDRGMFEVFNQAHPMTIEHLTFDHSGLGDQVAVEAQGSQPIVLRDVVGAGVTTLLRPVNAGKAFVEDTCCGTIDVSGDAGVWLRQVDSEGSGTRIVNHGAPLWILGAKTEGNCTVVDNDKGQTEIMGGLLYIVHGAEAATPAFRDRDGRLYIAYAEEAFKRTEVYQTHVVVSEKDRITTVVADDLPPRNLARIQPGANYQ